MGSSSILLHAGARSGSIQIADNATGSPQTVMLSGAGQLVPEATLSPTSLTFASVDVGSTSAAQSVTLSNKGTAALTISGISLSGTDAADFTETTTCGSTLAINATCTISLTFKPTTAGSLTASVVVNDNANNVTGSTQTVDLAGTGVATAAAPDHHGHAEPLR